MIFVVKVVVEQISSQYDSANAVEKSEHWRVAGELLVIRKVIQRLPGYRFHH